MNIKQKLFADLYSDPDHEYYGNATKCYELVYGCDYESARRLGSELLTKVDIKDYIKGKSLTIVQILEQNSTKLVNKAIELSTDKENTAVLNKLLDKLIPSLQENTNKDVKPDDMLDEIYARLKARQEAKSLGNKQLGNIPITEKDKSLITNNKDVE